MGNSVLTAKSFSIILFFFPWCLIVNPDTPSIDAAATITKDWDHCHHHFCFINITYICKRWSTAMKDWMCYKKVKKETMNKTVVSGNQIIRTSMMCSSVEIESESKVFSIFFVRPLRWCCSMVVRRLFPNCFVPCSIIILILFRLRDISIFNQNTTPIRKCPISQDYDLLRFFEDNKTCTATNHHHTTQALLTWHGAIFLIAPVVWKCH